MSDSFTVYEFWNFVVTFNNYMDKVLKPLTKKYGLTASQLRIIYLAHQFSDVTVGKLAKMAGIARTNTSSMCKKLASMGYMRKERKANDERVVEIVLTGEGKNAATDIEKNIMSVSDIAKADEKIRRFNSIYSEIMKKD